MEHPTQGRRRRHKSPSSVQSAPLLPVPRPVDCLDTEVGTSDEEGGKEAKRQKSEPTTPISTSSRPPNEYDEVVGITQVNSMEAERFEEGFEPEIQDIVEESPKIPVDRPDTGHVSGASHGRIGSSSLQECLEGLNQVRNNTPAPCHSRVMNEDSSNPPKVMSPNVEDEQIHDQEQGHDTLPMNQLLPEDKSQSRVKEERKDEEVTPKSETATESKEEVGDHDSEDLSEELRKHIDEFPPHDFEDSLGPEHVADELQRLIARFPPAVDSVPQHESREGATAPEAFREDRGPYAPRRTGRHRGRLVSPDPFMFHTTICLEHDPEASAHEEPIV